MIKGKEMIRLVAVPLICSSSVETQIISFLPLSFESGSLLNREDLVVLLQSLLFLNFSLDYDMKNFTCRKGLMLPTHWLF